MHNAKIVMNWSSGKDAALAYHLLTTVYGYSIQYLLTTINEANDRIFMHGTHELLLDIQAEQMNVPLVKVKYPPSTDHTLYDLAVNEAFLDLKRKGIDTAAYGDIFLQDLRQYRERQLAEVGLRALFPLCKKNTGDLIALIEQTGIEAIIVCVNEQCLGKEFLGKKINTELIQKFPSQVDPCGENGEFHTLVYNAPFFNSPLPIKTGEIVYRSYPSPNTSATPSTNMGFYFLDVHI